MSRFLRTIVCVATVAVLCSSTGLLATVAGQSGGAGTGGAVRLAQEQRLATNWRRVLMIGAHPDDEDNDLIVNLSVGQGIETAYLSLTRGDGGQNLIGPELGEALGVLRTEELAGARRIDGARQFFTRAIDFGFSKTAEETFRFWPHDSVLKDIVRTIRRFRPQVIVSVWSGTPADGHGHHQASGILSLEAFHAAGDPNRFPELRREGLAPWSPSKFYRTAGRFFASAPPPTLTFDGGVIDAASGFTLHQLAVRSRSQHRSQNQGELENLGPSRAGVRLEERVPGITGSDDSLFAGIVAPEPPASRSSDGHSVEAWLGESKIVLDATTDDDEVTPGQSLPVTLTAWNAGTDTVQIAVAMMATPGFTSRGDQCPQSGPQLLAPGALFHCEYTTDVWPKAFPTTPYYLQARHSAGLYQWRSEFVDSWGEPSEPPLRAKFLITPLHANGPMVAYRDVAARFKDPVLGEVRRAVMIVPTIAVDLEPNARLWPAGVRTRDYKVMLEHLARDSTDATVSLAVPVGWVTSKAQQVHFSREGERTTLTFKVTAARNVFLDTYRIDARVIVGHDTMDTGVYRIRYPHVRERNMLTAAQATVVVANVEFPAVGSIGYVRGGGDLVPEAMVNAGLSVTLLTGDALERDALDKFKVIVIGPRAYEADESLRRAHPRLMRWLNAGGTLVIQYEQTPYAAGGFAPLPLTFVRPTDSRVTDETAPVTLLAKTHPVLRAPNAIGDGDFANWVQERGLDFPPTWDPAWVPILETHDSGGPPLRGGLLVAKVGKGTAVYTGLAFHRQLPAIVPGAWRLWANILGVGQVGPVAKVKK